MNARPIAGDTCLEINAVRTPWPQRLEHGRLGCADRARVACRDRAARTRVSTLADFDRWRGSMGQECASISRTTASSQERSLISVSLFRTLRGHQNSA